jgi:hypothetical protein
MTTEWTNKKGGGNKEERMEGDKEGLYDINNII